MAVELRMCCKYGHSNRTTPICFIWKPLFTGLSAMSHRCNQLENRICNTSLFAIHGGVPFRRSQPTSKAYAEKGHPLIMR
jgi:hypothetical protein